MADINKVIGVFVIRMLLGLIFLMQGFGKVFTWGMEKVINADFFGDTFEGILPDSLIYISAYYTSYVELIGGFLLVIGLGRNLALYALSSVLIIVTFGHGLVEPIWNLSHVMFRTALLVPLLFMPREWDKLSLDYLIQKYYSKKEN